MGHPIRRICKFAHAGHPIRRIYKLAHAGDPIRRIYKLAHAGHPISTCGASHPKLCTCKFEGTCGTVTPEPSLARAGVTAPGPLQLISYIVRGHRNRVIKKQTHGGDRQCNKPRSPITTGLEKCPLDGATGQLLQSWATHNKRRDSWIQKLTHIAQSSFNSALQVIQRTCFC